MYDRRSCVPCFQTVSQPTVLHHDGQEAHNDLGAGSKEDLAFPTLLSIVDAFQGICENVHAHHDACKERDESSRGRLALWELLLSVLHHLPMKR